MKHEQNITPLNPNIVPEDTPLQQPVAPPAVSPIPAPLTPQAASPFPASALNPAPQPVTAPAPQPTAPFPQPASQPTPVPQPQYQQPQSVQSVYPPAPIYGANSTAAMAQSSQPVWKSSRNKPEGTLGFTSLLLSAGSVALFLLLIFKSGLVDSEKKAVIWLIVFVVLSVASLASGLISQKGKDKFDLQGLMGIIVATIVLINAVVIGSYYIKLKMVENEFKAKYNSSSTSSSDY